MLSPWNHLQPKNAGESSEQNSDFCPADDLWLKIADTTPEEASGTLRFSQNVIEHFLETEDTSNSE